MTTPKFQREAREEFDLAAQWYEDRAGLGRDFTDRVNETIKQIVESPTTHSTYDGRVRYGRVGRYPYVVLFLVRPDLVEIVGVVHTSRRPGYSKDRLDPAE